MASSAGQSIRPNERGRGSAVTRQRLLTAAAELIAELGWGRVTTRAVAARAGLPHGAVSYHFRGKQELLAEAALRTVEQAFPIAELEALETMADLMAVASARLGDREAIDPVLSAVMLEAMRESARDPAVRERIAALATLLAAAADGLLLHALLDPDVDITEALTALQTLLTR